MRTPHLANIKLNIQQKSSVLRSTEEKELLIEILAIESKLEQKDLLKKRNVLESTITLGPNSGICPCCGRPRV